MATRIIWSCDQGGCDISAEVIATLAIDGEIYGNDQWPPDGWGGLGAQTLCPSHEHARIERFYAENPGVELFA